MEELFGVKESASNVEVFIACDTRDSSPALVTAAKNGLDCLNVSYTDLGLLTTP